MLARRWLLLTHRRAKRTYSMHIAREIRSRMNETRHGEGTGVGARMGKLAGVQAAVAPEQNPCETRPAAALYATAHWCLLLRPAVLASAAYLRFAFRQRQTCQESCEHELG
jgi:hypothetical protein